MMTILYVRDVKVQIAPSAGLFPMSTLDLCYLPAMIGPLLRIGLVLMVALGSGTASAQRVGGMTRAEVYQQVRELSALGRRMFADRALSASGKLSCASCHSPDHAFGPPDALAVQSGGRDMLQPGRRAVPSLKYLQAAPS